MGHPLRLFPLRGTVSKAWVNKKEPVVQEEDDWLRCDKRLIGAGFGTTDPARRLYRRSQGGLFVGGARRSLQIFEEEEEEDNDDFLVVPKRKFRELSLIETTLRDERSALEDTCVNLDCLSLAEPSPAAAHALKRACDAEMSHCAKSAKTVQRLWHARVAKQRSLRPWRRRKGLPMTAQRAFVNGTWRAYMERERKLDLAFERVAMANEDAYGRLEARYSWARRWRHDYQLYCRMVAEYTTSLDETTFEMLGNTAGKTLEGRCRRGALAWQRMWRARGWVRRLRRKAAATKIQKRCRGLCTRRSWRPVLKLRRRVSTGRPLMTAFRQWRTCVSRTRRVRALTRRIKYGSAGTVLREWRGVVGTKKCFEAADKCLSAIADFFILEFALKVISTEMANDADSIVDDYAENAAQKCLGGLVEDTLERVVGDLASKLPAFMDDRWFLRHTPYATHLKLAEAGVLDRGIFDLERRKIQRLRSAAEIQRRIRGAQARGLVRPRVAALYRKKYHPEEGAYYYINARTGAVQWRKPALIIRLFPATLF